MSSIETPPPVPEIDVSEANRRLEGESPDAVLRWAAETFTPDVILTCSFQHDGVVLGHMLRTIAPWVPVVFLDTGFHFPETLAYRDEIVRRFGFNLRQVGPGLEPGDLERRHGPKLYERDPDFCCGINKVAPLKAALEGVRCWVNGRRRNQAATRQSISVVERFQGGIYKVNPMANWTAKNTHAYMREHGIPEHPLFEQGYASIGCWPCTRPVIAGEDERAGRWAGRGKTECGIHTMLKPEA
jgi:phosphoadenosine phosphosulfate reductase